MEPDRRRGVERIKGFIGDALPPRVRAGIAGWRAVEIWPEIAGPDAARRSVAVTFRDGRLFVEVVNSVWMCQLEASKRTFLRKLSEELGDIRVDDIVFKVNPRLGADG